MTVSELRKILRNAPGDAEVVMQHHGSSVEVVGYGVDKDVSGTTSTITLKTAAITKAE